MVGGSGPPAAFLSPLGDPGLFGPESITWKVHEDFIAMMIGGIVIPPPKKSRGF